MTVCVAVTVEDGIVFAADSASSALVEENGKSVIANVYRHGNKVFRAGPGNLDRAISGISA
jgi:predicted proteasome-type protease